MTAGLSLAACLPADFACGRQFAERLQAIYGLPGAARIVAQLRGDAYETYWCNALLPAAEQAEYDVVGEPVAGLPGLRQVSRQAGLSRHPAVVAGRWYIQNAASYFVAQCVNVAPDEEVLDLAAAPGSKTICLAAAMGNRGRLAAVEPVKARFHRLRANLHRCGVSNVELYMRDGRGVGRVVPERFDKVLLDAPCSSESRMRWDDAGSYRHWSPRKVKECQRKQKSLLRSAYAALKPGGTLIYSTCSFSPEENELVVAHLLQRSDAVLQHIGMVDQVAAADARYRQYLTPGLASWGKHSFAESMQRTLRILPYGVWDGFFVACLMKPRR